MNRSEVHLPEAVYAQSAEIFSRAFRGPAVTIARETIRIMGDVGMKVIEARPESGMTAAVDFQLREHFLSDKGDVMIFPQLVVDAEKVAQIADPKLLAAEVGAALGVAHHFLLPDYRQRLVPVYRDALEQKAALLTEMGVPVPPLPIPDPRREENLPLLLQRFIGTVRWATDYGYEDVMRAGKKLANDIHQHPQNEDFAVIGMLNSLPWKNPGFIMVARQNLARKIYDRCREMLGKDYPKGISPDERAEFSSLLLISLVMDKWETALLHRIKGMREKQQRVQSPNAINPN